MKKHIAIIIIQSIIMIFLIVVLFSEHRIGSDHNWFDEPSPNGKYIIHATFPEGISNFGSTEAQFALYDKERKKYFSVVLLMVDNNGKKPDNDNYKLDWYEDFVIITVIHHNGNSNSIRIYWEDF